MSLSNMLCVISTFVAIVAILYMIYEKDQRNSRCNSDPFAFRSVEENKRKHGTCNSLYEPQGANVPLDHTNEMMKEEADFHSGMVSSWRPEKVARSKDHDSLFPSIWMVDENESTVQSMKAPSKDKASKAANPERMTKVSAYRCLGNKIGTNPVAALRPKCSRTLTGEAIVFNGSEAREYVLNEGS